MTRIRLILTMTATIGSVLFSSRAAAQLSPTTARAAQVRITRGPEIERAEPHFAIIRWESNHPGGSPVHRGIVRYGTAPESLRQTASSPIRLNPGHSRTTFRVRLDGLQPRTTYYYKVDSMEANGRADRPKCTIQQFTTP
jgi:phosphodiesterase/alkaline phosphatase D-like protein